MKNYIKIILLFVGVVIFASRFVLYRYYYIDSLIEKSILDSDLKNLCGNKPMRVINTVINDREPIPSDTISSVYEYDITRIKEILLKKCPQVNIEIPRNTTDNIEFARRTDINKMDVYHVLISEKKLKKDFYAKEYLLLQSYTSKKNDYIYEMKNTRKFVWDNFQWHVKDNKTEKIRYDQKGFIEIKGN